MNQQISRIAIVSLLLLASLIAATTYWQVWAAPGLSARQDNAIQRVAQFEIKRGLIYAGQTVLAKNVAKKSGSSTLYFRTYPTKGFASQTVGYSTQGRARAGLERSQNAYLTAANANLGTIWDKLTDKLKGTTVRGNNLVLNLRVGAQKLAQTALAGKCGAAVVLNPKTGAVYVMASSPTYNPNRIESATGYASIIHAPAACPGSSAALLNRATQGLYSPGSTFKTVTAAAAMDSGKFTPDSRFFDPGFCEIYGQKVYNAGNPDQQGLESYGNVNLVQAFEHSINAVFCNIGKTLGAGRVLDQAKQFGFYSKPPIELPSNEVAASGLYNLKTHSLYDNAAIVDPGRLAFGQEHLLVTPLQMALVAGAVANGGVVMEPHLLKKVTSPTGKLVVKVKPQTWRRAMKPATAASLNQMMQAVVQSGTGTAAAIPGIKVAGKTGTAETGQNRVYTAWFIFFAPADNPQIAGAIVLEHQLNGFGGSVAAPIARQLMEAMLPGTSK
jgi:peptidoglycan glycosyltransferase